MYIKWIMSPKQNAVGGFRVKAWKLNPSWPCRGNIEEPRGWRVENVQLYDPDERYTCWLKWMLPLLMISLPIVITFSIWIRLIRRTRINDVCPIYATWGLCHTAGKQPMTWGIVLKFTIINFAIGLARASWMRRVRTATPNACYSCKVVQQYHKRLLKAF